jgi:hypothetical protein
MEGREIKRYLAGVGIATLVAAGITTVASVRQAAAA